VICIGLDALAGFAVGALITFALLSALVVRARVRSDRQIVDDWKPGDRREP
jgi:hypothetical protein